MIVAPRLLIADDHALIREGLKRILLQQGFEISAYLLKTEASSDVVNAIRSILRGEVYLSPVIVDLVAAAARKTDSLILDPLTPREREILQLIAEGKNNDEVSRELGMAVKTIESHRHNLTAKLSLHETAGLVRYAIKIGLVQS
jgi:DNA-binding NarL/FixJ family response regulator